MTGRSVKMISTALLLAGVACGPRPGPDTIAEPTATTEPAPEPVELFVEASGAGDTQEEAYREAVSRLALELFGSEVWLASLDVGLHDTERDPMRSSTTGSGQVQVVVGLERERVVALFDAIAEHPYHAAPPAHMAETLLRLYQVRLARSVCLRRRELLEEECEAASADEVGDQIQAMAQTIRLQPYFPDGVPLDSEGHPLRPITVVAEQRTPGGDWVRLTGLPLSVIEPEGSDAVETVVATTDDGGLARFRFGSEATWPEGTEVALDREQFLGSLADLWPGQRIELSGRRRGLQRWAMIASITVQGMEQSDECFAAAFQQSLRERVTTPRIDLRPDQVQALRSGSAEQIAATLQRFADAMAGRVDVLYRVELISEYVGRMGLHRMSYEARGQVEIFDVWTGRLLTSIDDAVIVAGIGEDRANRNAQEQLAARLANQICADVPEHL